MLPSPNVYSFWDFNIRPRVQLQCIFKQFSSEKDNCEDFQAPACGANNCVCIYVVS
jgi:hypothetical protein